MEIIRITDFTTNGGRERHTHAIFSITPLSGYLLMKEEYRKQDMSFKKQPWFIQLEFNTKFLMKMRKAMKGNLVCVYCGKPNLKIYKWDAKEKNHNIMATADHFWPKGQGGDAMNADNLVVCCYKCNNNKKDKFYDLDMLPYLNLYPKYKEKLSKLEQLKP